jgi:hypothetical protein
MMVVMVGSPLQLLGVSSRGSEVANVDRRWDGTQGRYSDYSEPWRSSVHGS